MRINLFRSGRRVHIDILFVALIALVAAWIACQMFIHNPVDRPTGLPEATIACFTAWLSEKEREKNKARQIVADTAQHAEERGEEHEVRIDTLEDRAGIPHPQHDDESTE